MSPPEPSKPTEAQNGAERIFEVRAIDGFQVSIRGACLEREDGFLVIRNSEGVIVYAAPEHRVADAIAKPAAPPSPPKRSPASSRRANAKPETASPPIEPGPGTPPAKPEPARPARAPQRKRPAGHNGGGSDGGARTRLSLLAEAKDKAAGYLRADLDARRAAALEQRLIESAQAAGYSVTALYRDPASAPASAQDGSGLRKLLDDAQEGFFSTVMLCAPASSARDIACIAELSALLGERGLSLMLVGQDGTPQPL